VFMYVTASEHLQSTFHSRFPSTHAHISIVSSAKSTGRFHCCSYFISFHFIYFVSGKMAHRVNTQREQSDEQTDRQTDIQENDAGIQTLAHEKHSKPTSMIQQENETLAPLL